MKQLLIFIFISLSFLFTSCSSISKEDCSKNMRDFGYDLGRRGQSNLIEDIRKTCLSSNPFIDLSSYQNGFEAGWSEYCTPFNGFRMGAKGDLFKSFCPPDREELFHDRFLIGKKVYEKKDQVRELQEKIMNIEEDGKNLTSATLHEELTRYKNELNDLNKAIHVLEQQGMKNVHIN